jgi:RyR domain
VYRYTEEQAARVCHAAHCALQAVQGESLPSPPGLDDLPAELRRIVIEGVRAARQGETAELLHARWVRAMAALGWTWGPERDPEGRRHPNMVPFWDLPPDERDKDELFAANATVLRRSL